MSTSRSNDLARPWSETTFNITNDPEKIEEARKIIENYDSYLITSIYTIDVYGKKLSKDQIVKLVNLDLDQPENRKIFKLVPRRKLNQILFGADVMQLYGGKSKNRRNKNKRRKSKRRKSRNRKYL
jgi:hypothetical protein